MAVVGIGWNNGVAERFFKNLKQKRVHWRTYANRFNAKQGILNYITKWYSIHWLHSYLDDQSTTSFEPQNKTFQKVV
jgi:transposase InsO family protein